MAPQHWTQAPSKRHQRLQGLEGCLLPVATANALGMALDALLTTSRRVLPPAQGLRATGTQGS